MKLPKAIFFDWDGTLADSYAFLEGAHNHVRMQLGKPSFRENEFQQYFGQPREILYKAFYAPHEEEAKKMFEVYVREHHLKLPALPGAEDLLKTLHAAGIPCGVVSNKKPEFIETEIRNFGWEAYFVASVGAGEASADKPSPAPLRLAVERAGLAGLEPDDIWFVGDTDNDLMCARDYGCPGILLGHMPNTPQLVAEFAPFLVVKDCHELDEFMLQCSK